jgi:hypothetical protein
MFSWLAIYLDGRRAAAHHGASSQEGGSPGHLVSPCLDVGAESKRSFCRLESQRQVRGSLIDASLDREVQGPEGQFQIGIRILIDMPQASAGRG